VHLEESNFLINPSQEPLLAFFIDLQQYKEPYFSGDQIPKGVFNFRDHGCLKSYSNPNALFSIVTYEKQYSDYYKKELLKHLENTHYLFIDAYRGSDDANSTTREWANFFFEALILLKEICVIRRGDIRVYKRDSAEAKVILLEQIPKVDHYYQGPASTYSASHGSLASSNTGYAFNPAQTQQNKVIIENDARQIFIYNSNQELIDSDHYRLQVLSEFRFESGELVFEKSNTETEMASIPFTEYDEYLVEINGKWDPGTYPLPHLSAHDVFLNLPEDCQIRSNPSLGTHQLIVENPVEKSISYKIRSPQFSKINWNDYQPKVAISSYPNEFKFIEDVLQKKMGNNKNPTTRLTQLITYFQAFTNINESLNLHSTVEKLSYCLENQVGSCLERSQLFMLAAAVAYNFQARIITNSLHAFVEVAYEPADSRGSHTVLWRAFDIGGTSGLTYLKAGGTAPSKEAKTKTSPALSFLESLQSLQMTAFTNITIVELLQLATKKIERKPSLIVLKSTQSIWDLWYKLKIELSNSKPIFFVQQPTDFQDLWQTQIIDRQQIREKAGALKNAVDKKTPSLMLIDWTDFDDASRASYMSLLDPQPCLFSQKIPDCIQSIHVLKGQLTLLGKAFLSRIEPLSIETLDSVPPPTAYNLINNPLRVNLYQLPMWKDHLLGNISATRKANGSLCWEQSSGLLATAMAQNRSLVLENVPKDDELQRLIACFNYGRYCYINGKYQTIPGNACYIYAEHTKARTDKPSFLVEKNHTKMPKSHGRYYLSRMTYWNFFGNTSVDNHGYRLMTGWFESWQASHVLIVTETLTAFEWQALCDYFQEKKPRLGLNYICLPGISVPWNTNAEVDTSQKKAYPSFRIAKSTDPYFTALTQYPKATHVHVSTQDSYGSIIDSLKASINEVTKAVDIQWYKTQLYQQLVKQKEDIVLVGALAPGVMQQLLPLLAEKMHATFDTANGSKTSWKGKLHWIAPHDQIVPVEHNPTLIEHSVSEYQIHLSQQKKQAFNSDIADLLNIWFDFLGNFNLPKNMPQKSIVDYQYWRSCYDHLCNINEGSETPHRSNPLKIMLYEYQRGSEWYCFLNVAAKLHFSKLSRPTFTQRETENTNRERWAHINRFSGACLARVFISLQVFKSMVSQRNHAVPTLRNHDSAIEALIAAAQDEALLNTASTRTHLEKPAQQLTWFLDQQNWRIAFLKSDFGLGKTHLIRQTLQKEGYQISEVISQWLTTIKQNAKCVLLLDEANLQQEGSFEFLYGLSTTSLFYRGQFYTIPKEAKVVATGNPEHYPGRKYHQILRQAYVITIKAANKVFFKQLFTEKLGENSHNTLNINILWEIYQLGSLWLAPLQQSIREMEYLIDYFQQSKIPMIDNVWREKIAFDLYYFRKPRAQFSAWKKLYLDVFPGSSVTEPESMRASFISTVKLHIEHRRHVLLEGDSGTGKSYLLNKLAPTLSKILLQGGQYGFDAMLIDGFKAGKLVIVDELNIKPNECLYNNFLTGVDENGLPLHHKSAQILATQNPGFYPGRTPLSTALLSRFITFYVPAITKEDLYAIAAENNLAKNQVADFILRSGSRTEDYNLRDFFAFCK